MPEITLLNIGFLKRDAQGNVLDADSTVTLVRGEKTILVDTGAPGIRNRILARLDSLRVKPKEIELVVNTHSHWDHCGNNELFRNAEIIVHKNENVEREKGRSPYRFIGGDNRLCEEIEVIETPGHTYGSISVVANSCPRYIICGDAVPTEDNFRKWLPPNVSVNEKLAIKSMERIREAGEIIIPGHGNMFSAM